ncbi:pentapeptide repeat-containing protein [Leptothermofonsia sp. ETS-13]|uniref:pentapeptide repeat-containing protein n=1 Tax=Leptothermofonsia sp. ETS-13 TaxID=3035696 RepID=UPI003BA350C9
MTPVFRSSNQFVALLKLLRKQMIILFCTLLWSGVFWAVGLAGFAPAFADDYNSGFLVGADFSERVLTDSSFTRANLRGTNFKNADLRGVSFFGANLEGANLEGANLSSATLDTARLTAANLKNAVLEGAFAFNAKFDGVIIDGADFTNVEVRQDTQMLLCKAARGTNPVTQRNTRDTLNCP